jgi:hypothetical protein
MKYLAFTDTNGKKWNIALNNLACFIPSGAQLFIETLNSSSIRKLDWSEDSGIGMGDVYVKGAYYRHLLKYTKKVISGKEAVVDVPNTFWSTNLSTGVKTYHTVTFDGTYVG